MKNWGPWPPWAPRLINLVLAKEREARSDETLAGKRETLINNEGVVGASEAKSGIIERMVGAGQAKNSIESQMCT